MDNDLAAQLQKCFLQAVREARAQGRTLTKQGLAKRVGVSSSSMYAYFSGATLPPAVVLDSLLIELGVDGRKRSMLASARDNIEVGGRSAAGWCTLPRDVPDFVGRTAELKALTANGVATFVIDGMAGVGKTTLAVHAAYWLAKSYPDGQLFVDLQTADLSSILDSLLRARGMPPEAIPVGEAALCACWRATTARSRLLIVLDNADSIEQLRPLMPGSPDCAVIVTSRRRLVGFEGEVVLSLDTLSEQEAAALFRCIVGERALIDERSSLDVTRLTGCLPLAVRVAASRLRNRPAWTVADLAHMLRVADKGGATTDVATAFELSYSQLDQTQQRVFRTAGWHPGQDFDAYAAAALAEIDLQDASACLENLLDVNLLRQRHAGRYSYHDLLREHARTTAKSIEQADGCRTGIERLLAFYLHAASRAAAVLEPTELRHPPDAGPAPRHAPEFAAPEEALRWLESERANLVCLTAHAAANGHGDYAWQLPHILRDFFYLRGYHADWLATHENALHACQSRADPGAEAITLMGLGFLQIKLGRPREARGSFERALPILAEKGMPVFEANALNNLGAVHWLLGDYERACTLHSQARASYHRHGHKGGEAHAIYNLARIASRKGRHGEAKDLLERALTLCEEAGRRYGCVVTLAQLGRVSALLGDPEQGLDYLGVARDMAKQMGFPWGDATTMLELGLIYRDMKRTGRAIGHIRRALRRARSYGDRDIEVRALNDLAEVLAEVGHDEMAESHHREALALAGDLIRYERARALEGIGRLTGDQQALAQALEIYREQGLIDDVSDTSS